MSDTTKQGVKNLNNIGPRRKKSRRDDSVKLACEAGVHRPGKWEDHPMGWYQVRFCKDCGAVTESSS